MVNKKLVVSFLNECIEQITEGNMLNIYHFCDGDYEKEKAVRYAINNELVTLSEYRNVPNMSKVETVTYKARLFLEENQD